MEVRRVAVWAGIVCGIGWLTKLLVMAVQGGPDPSSLAESVAFIVGLVGLVLLAAALGAHLSRHRPVWARAVSAAGAVLVTALMLGLLQAALTSLPGDAWVQSEAVFGLAGLAALAIARALSGARDG